MNPRHTDAAFQRYVQRGLDLLAASDTPEAKRTLREIVSGRVKVDVLGDLNAHDLKHARKDLHVHSKAAIARALNGYMWDDRVYVHRELSSKKLASTLVHEVTHVLNRSEEHYRSPKDALLEEYRSFWAEKRFQGVEMTPARCRALKLYVITQYGLKGVTPEDVPDVPPSRASTATR